MRVAAGSVRCATRRAFSAVLALSGARLLTLEPDEQPLAREAHNAAAAQHRHRCVLQRPAQDRFLVHLKKLRDLRRGEICRLGSLDLLTSRLEFDGLGHRSSLVWGLTTWLRRGCPRTIHLSLAHRKEWCRSPA